MAFSIPSICSERFIASGGSCAIGLILVFTEYRGRGGGVGVLFKSLLSFGGGRSIVRYRLNFCDDRCLPADQGTWHCRRMDTTEFSAMD